jgi:V-type H+-transporting ATPase subunit H
VTYKLGSFEINRQRISDRVLCSYPTPTMSLESQSPLDEYKRLIRDRPVAWDAYIRYNLVTDSDVKKIKAIDKVPKDKRVGIVEKDGEGYARLVLGEDGVLKKSANGNRVDIVQYILMWTGDLLDGTRSPGALVHRGRFS